MPGFGAPQAASESRVAALDDYFERLDAAFATLQQAPAQGADAATAPPPPESDASAGEPAAAATGAAAGQAETRTPRDAAAQPAAAQTPAPAPGAPAQMAGIAQAFSALFAAERGETAIGIPSLIGPAAMPQPSVDDLAERVTRQVLERLSDRIVRETVADVVSQVAERLVRDEIERVKATLK